MKSPEKGKTGIGGKGFVEVFFVFGNSFFKNKKAFSLLFFKNQLPPR
jgi:hypothetical protein